MTQENSVTRHHLSVSVWHGLCQWARGGCELWELLISSKFYLQWILSMSGTFVCNLQNTPFPLCLDPLYDYLIFFNQLPPSFCLCPFFWASSNLANLESQSEQMSQSLSSLWGANLQRWTGASWRGCNVLCMYASVSGMAFRLLPSKVDLGGSWDMCRWQSVGLEE